MDIKKLMVSCLILLSDPPSANPRISFTAALKILNKLKTILLSVCLYPKVKTAEPIGPKFCVVPHMTHRKGLNLIKISKSSPHKIRFFKFKNQRLFFYKIRELLMLLFYSVFIIYIITVYSKRKSSR